MCFIVFNLYSTFIHSIKKWHKYSFENITRIPPILLDSAYTERYMGMPTLSGNYKGYQEADLSRQVDGFKDKMFYLVHGTADDNVHLQQSMELARALSQAGIIYRQQVSHLQGFVTI